MTNSILSTASSTMSMASPLGLPLAMVASPNSSSSSSSSKTLSKYSQSIPFLARPQHLKNQYAGDVGFDPLNLASSPENLEYYREAEVKHARIAMLAAAGWPLSELFDKPLTALVDEDFGLNLSPLVDGGDRVPSLLNGGLSSVSPLFWGLCIGLTAAIDLKGIQNSRYGDATGDGNDYSPGNYGFDPLNLYPSDEAGRERMQLAEIKHGRLGMLAITGFAAQEYVSKVGVVDETPLFFQPFHF